MGRFARLWGGGRSDDDTDAAAPPADPAAADAQDAASGPAGPVEVRPDVGAMLRRPLAERPLVRVGAYAWALIGIGVVVIAAAEVVAAISPVVIALVLALFPAAVLAPVTSWLRERGFPPALAATTVLLGSLAVVAGIVSALAPIVANELDSLQASLQEGYDQIGRFLASGPFGLDPIRLDELTDRAVNAITSGDGVGLRAVGIAQAVLQGATGLFFAVFVLFFYLKDGAQIGQWLKSLFPERARADAEAIGEMTWNTVGSYIRGQLLIAVIDGFFIGIGLVILRVPLALPLGVLVFFGGLFPIVGAVAAGAVAALVALATGGLTKALLVIVMIVAVQQLEGNLLQPVILGRATELHPLAVVGSITAGAILLGVLGAFLSVPVAAGAARAVGYLRRRVPG